VSTASGTNPNVVTNRSHSAGRRRSSSVAQSITCITILNPARWSCEAATTVLLNARSYCCVVSHRIGRPAYPASPASYRTRAGLWRLYRAADPAVVYHGVPFGKRLGSIVYWSGFP